LWIVIVVPPLAPDVVVDPLVVVVAAAVVVVAAPVAPVALGDDEPQAARNSPVKAMVPTSCSVLRYVICSSS
jgi:hypothetical protein